MRRFFVLLLAGTLVAVASSGGASARGKKAAPPPAVPVPAALDAAAAQKVVEEAKAQAVSISAQVQALIGLGFPSGPVDPAVREAARNELVVFGEHSISAMAAAVSKVTMENRAPLVQTMMAAFRQMSFGLPTDYLPGMEAAIWFGDRAARELAIPELARFRQRGATLTMVDAAIEDPALTAIAARAMGQIGDPRARYWLETVLRGSDPTTRSEAAVALSRIGGPALQPLKDAMRSDERALRETACRALLPVAGLEDVTALHAYAATHADDDAGLMESVRTAAAMLEEAMAARQANDSATPPSQ